MADRTALIVGVGVAGPTLAYWLLRQGFKVTLVERAPQLRNTGYVIDFWGRGFDIAERMGVMPEIQRAGYNVRELCIVDTRGRRISGFKTDVFLRATGGKYITIPRGDLAAIIYGKVAASCETLFGDSVAEIAPMQDHVHVTFERAPPRAFDVVIGAGGQHSVIRKLAFGQEDQFETYLGYMVAAFETVGYRPRDEDAYVSYSVPGKQVARFAMRDDRTMFLLVYTDELGRLREPHDVEGQKKMLAAEFSDVGWECPQILKAMASCNEIYLDRVSQIRVGAWSKGRIGLVGDAAFAPSLIAGQGAALAMIGAYVLAGELGRPEATVEQAFARYEALLHPFMSAKQDAAAKFAGSFAPRTQLGLLMRNQVARLFGLPLIADWAMGSLLFDRIDLPEYQLLAS